MDNPIIPQPKVIDKLVGFEEDHTDSAAGPQLVIRHTQEIPSSYLDRLKREKMDSVAAPAGNLMKIASIPVVVVEQWKREGFDIYEATAREIVARLNNTGLDAFITTNKRV